MDDPQKILFDRISELVEQNSYQKDEEAIRDVIRRVRAIQSLKALAVTEHIVFSIYSKWMLRRDEFSKSSAEARFIRLTKIVLDDINKQERRIRARLNQIKNRQKLVNANNSGTLTSKLLLDELTYMRRSAAHSEPRNSLEKEVAKQETHDLVKEKRLRDMAQWKEDIKARSDSCNVNIFATPENVKLLKEKEEFEKAIAAEEEKKKGDIN